jgi:hypothetical protein
MRAELLFTAFLLSACASAGAQTSEEDRLERIERAEADVAFANSRLPYRGHTPFAVASVEPFGEREWFVLSFFHYWTGSTSTKDAKEHYLVKRVAGAYEGHDFYSDKNRPGEPGATSWAWSDSCPQLDRSIARFEFHERTRFKNDPLGPPSSEGTVTIAGVDATSLLFWAQLGDFGLNFEVNLLTPYDSDSGVARWVKESVSAISGCFLAEPPMIPAVELPVPPAVPPEPFSIFDLARDRRAAQPND